MARAILKKGQMQDISRLEKAIELGVNFFSPSCKDFGFPPQHSFLVPSLLRESPFHREEIHTQRKARQVVFPDSLAGRDDHVTQ